MALVGTLDLFVLLAEYVVGSIFLSLIVWGLILLITGIIGRLSIETITVVLATYFLVASVGYVGALAAVPLAIWALWYMITGIIGQINQM